MKSDGRSHARLQSDAGPNAKARDEFEAKLASAAADVEDDYDADVYLYSGEIGDDGYGQLVSALVSAEPRSNALLLLVTHGGSANAAYQIARLLQKTYRELFLYAPSYCKSAGTIVALGANKLIMDDFSELGPLDVQLPSSDELWEQRSGLVSRSAFQSLTEASFDMYQQFMLSIKMGSRNRVSFKLASDISSTLTCQLMSPVYSQINPDQLGRDFRALNVAVEYGNRLAKYSRNARHDAVKHLVENYPSHDFIIDDEEARTLFRRVEEPRESLYALLDCLGDPAFGESQPPIVCSIRGTYAEEAQTDDTEKQAQSSKATEASVDGDRSEDRASDPTAGSEKKREGRSPNGKPVR